MKALVGAFNQEKVGAWLRLAFSVVIVKSLRTFVSALISYKHQTPFIAVYIFLSSRKNKDIKTEAKEHEFDHNNNKVFYVIYTDGDMQYACMPFIA